MPHVVQMDAGQARDRCELGHRVTNELAHRRLCGIEELVVVDVRRLVRRRFAERVDVVPIRMALHDLGDETRTRPHPGVDFEPLVGGNRDRGAEPVGANRQPPAREQRLPSVPHLGNDGVDAGRAHQRELSLPVVGGAIEPRPHPDPVLDLPSGCLRSRQHKRRGTLQKRPAVNHDTAELTPHWRCGCQRFVRGPRRKTELLSRSKLPGRRGSASEPRCAAESLRRLES